MALSFRSSNSAGQPTPAPIQDRERIVFGSRLAGPVERAERLAAIRQRSRLVAGVTVPPRPDEPDNCCMSGCVNCVWDRYRDEMEEWALASAEAKRLKLLRGEATTHNGRGVTAGEEREPAAGRQTSRLGQAKKGGAGLAERAAPAHGEGAASSMDDDGGGSLANWRQPISPRPSSESRPDSWNEDLYRHVPVGIRQFMKVEKMLKEKHSREGTRGG